MLNTMMKNENKTFANTAIFSEIPDQGICEHDLKKEITCVIILGKR